MNNYRQTTDNKETISEAEQLTTESSSTTSSSLHTNPGVLLAPADMETIRIAYESVLGLLNSVRAHDIEWALGCGLKLSAILDAIDQTAMARNPSHFYLRAILQRYVKDEIFTREIAAKRRRYRSDMRKLHSEDRWSSWYGSPQGFDI